MTKNLEQPFADVFTTFAKTYTDKVDAHRQFADQLYTQGGFEAASWYFQQTLALSKTISAQDANHLAACFFALKRYPEAVKAMQQAVAQQADNPSLLTNLGIMLKQNQQYAEAETVLLKSYQLKPDFLPTLDALVGVYGKQQRLDKAQALGHESLQLKDKTVHSKKNLAILKSNIGNHKVNSPIPDFDPHHPERNIIAFSLWGKQAMYYQGALLNAQIAPAIYPTWTCRFYCDASVPNDFQERLKSFGAQVVIMPHAKKAYEGLFWRFLVADDKTIDRYIIRDCDCVLNSQERVAVDEWIASDQHFHIMRDFYTHSELILAGLWGGVSGALPPLKPLIDAYCNGKDSERTIDQRFLREQIWPLVKQSYLGHDSQFAFDNAQDFPTLGRLEGEQRHVGQNFRVAMARKKTTS